MVFDTNKSDNSIKSFLMIGQSNMAGRGEFGEVEPINNPNCYMLRMGKWQKMSEPINPDRPIFEGRFHSGICLAASFADELSKHSGEKVGLIPCADGGTKINEWQPGGVLFDHAVMMTKLAMRNSRLCGIIWHQGESDCKFFNREEYRRDFLNTMTSFRREFGNESLPLIIGELSENISVNSETLHLKEMNMLLHELKDELPHTAIASAKELTLKEDNLHFDSKSLRILGQRYFREYIALTEFS